MRWLSSPGSCCSGRASTAPASATLHAAPTAGRGQGSGRPFSWLMASLAITAEEAAGGLAASIVVGMLIALIFAQSRWIRRMLYPYTILLQTVPIVA